MHSPLPRHGETDTTETQAYHEGGKEGRRKMKIMQGKPGNELKGQLVGYFGSSREGAGLVL